MRETVLVGQYDEPGESAGSYSLMTIGETIGAAVRTKDRGSVDISVGEFIDLPGAINLALRCVKGYAEETESLFESKPASKINRS